METIIHEEDGITIIREETRVTVILEPEERFPNIRLMTGDGSLCYIPWGENIPGLLVEERFQGEERKRNYFYPDNTEKCDEGQIIYFQKLWKKSERDQEAVFLVPKKEKNSPRRRVVAVIRD